jgi:hypothetical protein
VAEERSVTGELASGMRSILERVGEFFHVFDLSYFVGGASTFGALGFLYLEMGKPMVFPFAPWVGGLALILACYVCGLVAFAAGRWINNRLFRRRKLDVTLPAALSGHRLTDEETIKSYLTGEPPDRWWLYQRMWSEIAHKRSARAVLDHLMRSWAIAATYDAVAFSFVVWAAAAAAGGTVLSIVGAAACLVASLFAFHRGAEHYKDQIQVAVAHFAVVRGPLIEPRSRGGP